MLGAILGDIAGSTYEFVNNRKKPAKLWTGKDFFTDDTILTCATCYAILMNKSIPLKDRYYATIRMFVQRFPYASYGAGFVGWIRALPQVEDFLPEYIKKYKQVFRPRDSLGNGSAMKISPVVYVAENLKQAREMTRKLTSVTHNTPQGLKAADALVVLMWEALNGASKAKLKDKAIEFYPEVEGLTYEKLNKEYEYSELAEDTMPAAIVCFLESSSFDDALKNAVSIGGDADTLGAIVGALAEAFYKYDSIEEYTKKRELAESYLKPELTRMVRLIDTSKLIRK